MKIKWNRRITRRYLVIVLYGGWAAMLASLWSANRLEPALALLALPAGLAFAGALGWLMHFGRTYGEIDDTRGKYLDERQTNVRNAATTQAYHLFTGTACLWLLYEYIARTAAKLSLWTPSLDGEYQAIMGTAVVLAMTLPAALIAWHEPDGEEFENEKMRETA
ncbi:MAG: hypothetical protein K2X35_21015 [Bryobacteraceae bacterium]|nr:hypothetical protein [Bryobacteraceae bacterium]